MMKKYLIILFCLFSYNLHAQSNVGNEFIAVIGEASETFLPDLISFHFSIRVVEKKQSEAVKQLNIQSNQFIDKVISLGIDAKSIQLAHYNLEESFDYSDDKPKKVGYEASESFEIEIKFTDERFNLFIDSISGTKFPNISFTYALNFSDSLINEVRNLLIRKASDNAAQIAKVLAESRNLVLGEVYSIEYTRNIASLYGVDVIPPPTPIQSNVNYQYQIRADKISIKGVEKMQQVRIVYRINNAR